MPGRAQVSADAPRLPRETLAFREELDVLKFLCKDLWVSVFQKQMDSLRTNHQVCAHAQHLLPGCRQRWSHVALGGEPP